MNATKRSKKVFVYNRCDNSPAIRGDHGIERGFTQVINQTPNDNWLHLCHQVTPDGNLTGIIGNIGGRQLDMNDF